MCSITNQYVNSHWEGKVPPGVTRPTVQSILEEREQVTYRQAPLANRYRSLTLASAIVVCLALARIVDRSKVPEARILQATIRPVAAQREEGMRCARYRLVIHRITITHTPTSGSVDCCKCRSTTPSWTSFLTPARKTRLM